jgi:hypothetical protein
LSIQSRRTSREITIQIEAQEVEEEESQEEIEEEDGVVVAEGDAAHHDFAIIQVLTFTMLLVRESDNFSSKECCG